MALAFVMVVLGASRQSELRRRAAATLDAALADCEVLPSARARASCRASLHPLPRDNAALGNWNVRDP